MSRLKEVYGQNVLCFGEVHLNLYNIGLTAVLGEKVDGSAANSNGAGKTSIFHLIHWILSGRSLQKYTQEQMVHWSYPEKGALGAALFESGTDGKTYLSQRYAKHPKYNKKNKLVIRQETPGKGWDQWDEVPFEDGKDLQITLDSLLGYTRELFEALVLFGIGSRRFSQMGDTAQKQLLEQVLALSLYAEASKRAKHAKDSCKQQIQMAEQLIQERKRVLQQHDSGLEDSQRCKEEWDWEREDKYHELMKIEIEQLQSEIQAEQLEVQRLNVVGPLDRDEHLERLRVLEGEEEVGLSELETMMVRYQEKRQEFQTQYNTWVQESLSFQQQIYNLQQMQYGAPCTLCNQPLNQQHDLEPRLYQLQHSLQSAQTNVSYFSEMLNGLDQAFRGLEEKHKAKMSDLQARRHQAQVELEDVTLKENAYTKALDGLQKKEQELVEMQQKEQEWLSQKSIENPWDTIIAQAQEVLLEKQKEVEEAEQQLIQATDKMGLYRVVERVLGTKGVRSFLFESLAPELNQSLHNYCGIVSGGQLMARIAVTTETSSGDLREKIGLFVQTPQRETSYESRSNGEKRRLDLPILFALQNVAALRGTSLGLTMLDEVFESVDESGVSGVVQLLRTVVQRPHTSTILAITHNAELAQHFPQQMLVSMEQEVSSITMVS